MQVLQGGNQKPAEVAEMKIHLGLKKVPRSLHPWARGLWLWGNCPRVIMYFIKHLFSAGHLARCQLIYVTVQ